MSTLLIANGRPPAMRLRASVCFFSAYNGIGSWLAALEPLGDCLRLLPRGGWRAKQLSLFAASTIAWDCDEEGRAEIATIVAAISHSETLHDVSAVAQPSSMDCCSRWTTRSDDLSVVVPQGLSGICLNVGSQALREVDGSSSLTRLMSSARSGLPRRK